MFRNGGWIRCVLSATLFASAGCSAIEGIPWLPHHQSLFFRDDPRCGEFEIGRGWLCPWDDITDEAIIIGEPVTACLKPSAKQIQADLEEQGICTRIVPANEALHASRDLVAMRLARASAAPVVVIGSGQGIVEAVRICRHMQLHHLPVDCLILAGNTCCETIPDNVASCVNIYHCDGGGRRLPGKPVFREGNQVAIVNYDLTQSGDEPEWIGLSDQSRDLIIRHVVPLFGPANPQVSARNGE